MVRAYYLNGYHEVKYEENLLYPSEEVSTFQEPFIIRHDFKRASLFVVPLTCGCPQEMRIDKWYQHKIRNQVNKFTAYSGEIQKGNALNFCPFNSLLKS